MYRTIINGQELVIRFSLTLGKKDDSLERQLIETVLGLEEKLLLYKSQPFAISHPTVGLIVAYVQEGDILDVQIQQIVPIENVL